MWMGLAALLSGSTPGGALPAPSCACVVSELDGPCGYEREGCRCSDGHGWSSYWLYDPASGTCEEYRVIRSQEEDGRRGR